MRKVAALLLLVCLVALAPCRQSWAHSQYASEQIEDYRKHFDVPGISVAIAKKGQIVFAKGFGFADVERNVPVQPTDYFRLASVSKPITATMIFELVEQGKVNLDAPIRQYVPELPEHHVYRVRDLLSHQSGVRHYGNDPALRNYTTQISALSRFAKDPLLFSPGEKFSYSTHAFTVLGALIEKVVKKPYRTYAAERLQAWGIKDVQCETGVNPKRTKVYTKSQGKNKVADRDDLSWKYAGGGYEATAIGMCSLGSAILSGKILKTESLEKMWTVQKPKTGASTMALGWSISEVAGTRFAVHGGSQLGANSSWGLQVGGDTVVMVLSNQSGHHPARLATFLEELVQVKGDAKLPTIKLD
jgi:CubicO group peptidase (beta-lactamase class C family)